MLPKASECPVTDEAKAAVWQAFRERRPTRVPVTFSTNPRVVLLNESWNPDRITFEQFMTDAKTHVDIVLRHQLFRRQVIGRYSDGPHEPPDVWPVNLEVFNTYEAAYFGAPLHYYGDQVPDTVPYLADDNRDAVFDVDIERPLENPFISHWLSFWSEMEKVCEDMTFEGRPVELRPWALCGTDGPVTAGMNLRGPDFLIDLVEEPEYANRLMQRVIDGAVSRRKAFIGYWGDRIGTGSWLADDSVAMLGVDTYIQRVLPMHRRFLDAVDTGSERGIHLCGDATRLFPAIHRQLNVTSFDTGFPIDFAWVREQLGEAVEISGGPDVATLLQATPQQVHQRTVEILQSGIMRGGRFILREGNNLPPNVPEANLEAMYLACLERGRYE